MYMYLYTVHHIYKQLPTVNNDILPTFHDAICALAINSLDHTTC